ncbi:F0F1 ATP synthase subunit B [Gangjinia marincola]|uniref:ATP synthase subunit b n=1 Tax=Gangjinia marincola TaxID=578463 RepID=A0ABN1MID3_9FLAO
MDQLLNDFSPGLFIMQTVILLVLIFLMVKFAWKPILNSLNEREEGIQGALDAAEAAKREMQNLKADNDQLLQEARTERDSLLKDARAMKDKMIADATDEAQAKADLILIKAQEAIQSEKQAALADIKNQVAKISVEIAEKMVRHELDNKDKQMKLVDDMLGDVTLN